MVIEHSIKEPDTAIVTITRQGTILGRRLRQLLPCSCLYVPDKFAGKKRATAEISFVSLKNLLADIFPRYRYLVLIMATGIAVRLLSGELKSKYYDPGVIIIDDAGMFCISLLSGHTGGANELAGKIASLIGAQPVITTASDVNKTLSLDLLGREYGWEIKDKTHLKAASAVVVNGEPVGIYQDAGEIDWQTERQKLADNITIYTTLEALKKGGCQAAIIITDRILDEETSRSLPDHTVIYRPKSLVVGIGCNRGVACDTIETAIDKIFIEHGLSTKSLKMITTIDLKKDEPGLLKYARNRNIHVEYHDRESLRKTKFPSSPSKAAMQNVGTPSVCEAAALLSSHSSTLLVPKQKFSRSVTVAIARMSPAGGNAPGKGRLFLVGTGPGDLKYLTFAARDAIDRSEVIIGYKTYINLIKPLLLGSKLVIVTGMGAEIERVKTSISLAKQGKTVALISSGDCGIYGMSGPVGEMLMEQPDTDIEVMVIPGVPAVTAGAALLGSPISGDFVSISLSDYLVPWEEIRRRLELAAQGNFVIVVYNPQSRLRCSQLSEALEIIMQHRPPTTIAGIATNAYRPGQAVKITDLAHVLDSEINMNTTIIIGNNTTRARNGWMATPRGYSNKYDMQKEAR